jgi:hypothetical protein
VFPGQEPTRRREEEPVDCRQCRTLALRTCRGESKGQSTTYLDRSAGWAKRNAASFITSTAASQTPRDTAVQKELRPTEVAKVVCVTAAG